MHGINFMERVNEDIEVFSVLRTCTIGEIMDPTLYFTVQCIPSLLKGRKNSEIVKTKLCCLLGKQKMLQMSA